jgi:hypothetical protein
MFQHVPQDRADVLVGRHVENLLAAALGTHQSADPQAAQVVADQGLRQAGGRGDLADRLKRLFI